MTLLTFPYATIFDTSGVLSPGAKAYFYQSGTTTPLDTYSDADLQTANTNPVIADAAGALGPIYLKAQQYKVVVKDANDSTIKTIDNYSPIATGEQILWAGTVGGTADAVLLTTDPLINALRDGTRFWWRALSSNTGAMTVNVDGLGVKSLKWPNGAVLRASDVAADAIIEMVYDITNDVYNIISTTAPPLYASNLNADIVDDGSGNLTTMIAVVPHAVDFSFVATDRVKRHRSSAASKTWMLLAAATAGNGWNTEVEDVSGGTVIASPSTNLYVNGAAAAASYTMVAGEFGSITTNGTDYYLSTANRHASASVSGVAELATNAEAQAGTDASRTITPAALSAVMNISTHDVAASRALATNYTNSYGYPIFVSVTPSASGANTATAIVDGVSIKGSSYGSSGANASIFFMVPAGKVYQVNDTGPSPTVSIWVEWY